MKKTNNKEVFPEGLKVLLPEDARKEEHITRRINDFFYKNGYQPVKTPLMEYEKKERSEFFNPSEQDSFMLVEPETKKVLVLRSDITAQVANLASSKLKSYNRPLRLCYSGEVLRNSKNIYQTDRQFKQIGAEIIGAPGNKGLIEIIDITVSVLKNLNINNINIDFSLPSISRYIDSSVNFETKIGRKVKESIDNKDISLIKSKKYDYINGIINLSGPINNLKMNLKKYIFPKEIKYIIKKFFLIYNELNKKIPKLNITIDMTEGKSFLKYKNLGFKIYNKDNASVIAIGGDYMINEKESGLGISLMINKISDVMHYSSEKRVYVPYKNNNTRFLNKFKNKIFVKELFPNKNSLVEAKKQSCFYILTKEGKLEKIKK